MSARLARIEERAKIRELLRKNDFVEPGVTDDQLEQLFLQFYASARNPCAREYMVVGEEAGDLIAFHAAIPFRFRAFGKDCVGGLGSNLVVDRVYRHGLAFLQLQKFFFGGYAARGIDFIYGLVTRKEVLQVHLRTGYKAVGETPVYARPYRLEKLAARVTGSERVASAVSPLLRGGNSFLRMGPSAPSDIQVEKAARFPAEIDDFASRNLARFEVHPLRTAEILNWRFTTLEHRNYEIFIARKQGKICGYVVLRLMSMREFKTLAIVDVLFDWETPDAAKALLATVHGRALALQVDLVSVIHTEASPLRSFFRRAGFLRTPESFTLVVNNPRGGAAPLGPEHYGSWHVTWFDHDVV
jgi:N-acetylglutamate synthase-like GNAT family acetyltransferase